MTIDLGLLIVALASLVGVLVVVWRKFPQLSSINVDRLPGQQQLLVKGKILEERLKRKAQAAIRRVGQATKPITATLSKTVSSLSERLEALDREYLKQRSKTGDWQHHVQLLLDEAGSLLEAGERAGAEKKFIEVISLDHSNLDAYRGLGDVYLLSKDYPHARESLEFALRLSHRLAAADYERSPHRGGQRTIATTITLNSELAAIHADLGEVFDATGDRRIALDHFLEATKLEPANPRYIDRLTTLAIALNDRVLAEEGIEKLKQVNPGNQKIVEFEAQVDKLNASR